MDDSIIPLQLDDSIELPSELPEFIRLGDIIVNNSTIRQACIGSNCNYIAKIQTAECFPYYKLRLKLDGGEICQNITCPSLCDVLRNELSISLRADRLWVGAKLHAVSFRKDGLEAEGILVMDNYDGTLLDLFFQYQSGTEELVLDETMDLVKDHLTILHQNDITHCDITPENIMYKRSGEVVILDYGQAVITNSDLLQANDWAGYQALESIISKIDRGVRYLSPDDMIEDFIDEVIPRSSGYSYEWNGQICPGW